MHRLSLRVSLILIAALALPTARAYAQAADAAQSNAPAAAQAAQRDVEDTVRRFGIGVDAGVGLDPEIVMFGGHGTFGRVFSRAVSFRPGVEFGIGEVTTLMNINLDVLYSLPGSTRSSRWMAYVG